MDKDELVDNVTKIIMSRLGAGGQPASGGSPALSGGLAATVVTFGEVPASVLGAVTARAGRTPADVDGAQYIVLTQAAFRAIHGGAAPVSLGGYTAPTAAAASSAPACQACGSAFDLTGKKVVSDRDLRSLGLTSGATVRVGAGAIVTALARDYATGVGAQIVR